MASNKPDHLAADHASSHVDSDGELDLTDSELPSEKKLREHRPLQTHRPECTHANASSSRTWSSGNQITEKVPKEKVVLEGGGDFEEGICYLVRRKDGHTSKMMLKNGIFIPYEPGKNMRSVSGHQGLPKEKVVLEGGGEFEEGTRYLVRSKDGHTSKMMLKNGIFIPYSPDQRMRSNFNPVLMGGARCSSTRAESTSVDNWSDLDVGKSSTDQTEESWDEDLPDLPEYDALEEAHLGQTSRQGAGVNVRDGVTRSDPGLVVSDRGIRPGPSSGKMKSNLAKPGRGAPYQQGQVSPSRNDRNNQSIQRAQHNKTVGQAIRRVIGSQHCMGSSLACSTVPTVKTRAPVNRSAGSASSSTSTAGSAGRPVMTPGRGLTSPAVNKALQQVMDIVSQTRQSLGQGANPQPNRNVIWKGDLVWKDSTQPHQSGHTMRRCDCTVSTAKTDPPVNTTNWPQELTMQLLPKSLLYTANFLPTINNSRHVMFQFTNTNNEDLKKLYKVFGGGFAGCVHFPPHYDIRVLLLLFNAKKKCFKGIIANDQDQLVNRLRHVITEQKQRSSARHPMPSSTATHTSIAAGTRASASPSALHFQSSTASIPTSKGQKSVSASSLPFSSSTPSVPIAKGQRSASASSLFYPSSTAGAPVAQGQRSSTAVFTAPTIKVNRSAADSTSVWAAPSVTSTGSSSAAGERNPAVAIQSVSLLCEACDILHGHNSMVECCVGHLICTKCVEKSAKAVLTGATKGSVVCSKDICTNAIPQSELRKALPTLVMDLLEERWKKETLEALADMKDVVKCKVCGYSGVLDMGIKQFQCMKCKKSYCRYCEMEWQQKQHDLCIKTKTRKIQDSGTSIQVPAHWSEEGDKEIYSTVELDIHSPEFNEVAVLFGSTLHGHKANIKMIYRIQNLRLWDRYSLMRSHMVADLGELHLKEKRLFHGTQKDVVDAICREGFDWRLCGKHGVAFGKGTYFAKNAAISHQYSSKDTGGFAFGPFVPGGGHGLGFGFGRPTAIPLPLPGYHGNVWHGPSAFGPGSAQQAPSGTASTGFHFGASQPSSASATSGSAFAPTTTSSGFSFGTQQQNNTPAGAGFNMPVVVSRSSTGFPIGPSQQHSSQQNASTFGFSLPAPNLPSGSSSTTQSSGFTFGPVSTSASSSQSSGQQFQMSSSGSNLFVKPLKPSNPSAFGAATSSSHTSACVGNSREHLMFVGRVLVGRTCPGSPEMLRPGKDPADPEGKMCHSAVDNVNNPKIFVVFDMAQCYPEYLIKYS